LRLLALLAALLPCPGCVAVDVAVFHRSAPDLVYSAVTGRDCSIVRLDRGDSYCKPVAPPVPPQPYCTRALGGIDCWTQPQLLADHPAQVADGPSSLTPEQNQARLARWPSELQ